MADGEYEVESILQAKVVGGKRGKRAWSYWVKWKGYGLGDNTWEPATSFKGGSEHFIDHFWDRIDIQGRDVTNLREFSVGEEFFPSGPPRKKTKKAKEPEKSPPAAAEGAIEISDSDHEAPQPPVSSGKRKGKQAKERERKVSPPQRAEPPRSEPEPVASGRRKGKKAKGKEESPPPQVQLPDSEFEVRSLVNDKVEEVPASTISTKSRRRRSSVSAEEEPARPKGKRGRPPGKRPSELEAEIAQLELEPVIVDELPPPPPKRKRGRPPGIPVHEMEMQAQSELAVDEPAPPPAKRKRGRPPGLRPAELEAVERGPTEGTAPTIEATSPKKMSAKKSLDRERVVPDSRAESSRGRKPTAAESPKSVTRRLSLPRRHGRVPKTVPSSVSPSADELLIVPQSDSGKGKGKTSRSKKTGMSAEDAMDVDELPEPSEPAGSQSIFGLPTLLGPNLGPEEVPEDALALSVPAHRWRAANPRVKVTDDLDLTEVSGPDAIAVKARFMKRAINGGDKASGSSSRPPRVSSSKAGPGKSSAGLFPENNSTRLMAQKGVLTSVKPRNARKAPNEPEGTVPQNGDAGDVVDGPSADSAGVAETSPEPEIAPTGQELLEAAGMNDQAVEDLPDFEEDNADKAEPQSVPEDPQDEVMEAEPPRAFGSVSAVVGQAPEAPVLQAKPVAFASRVGIWNSTIFGPLALGFPGRSQSENGAVDVSPEAKRYTFHLNLDPAVSIPIALKDVHASQPFLDGLDTTARNPTGKFYKDNYAIALVDTFKAKESFARVILTDSATDEQKGHFQRFISRLGDGELFIQMNRAETLVMCGSDNPVLGQKLGFPPQLLGLGDTAIMAHVDIENYSQYAEAAVHADATRW